MLDAAKTTGTNVAAAAFVLSRPQPNAQSSSGIGDTSRGPAAASASEGYAHRPAEGEEDKCKLNFKAKGFIPSLLSSTPAVTAFAYLLFR